MALSIETLSSKIGLPKSIRRSPVFLAGLALRLLLIVCLAPQIQQTWFVPFVEHAIAHPSLDPWTTFLDDGGTPLAYPYGPMMLIAHLPTLALGWSLAAASGHAIFLAIGFRASLLLADFAALLLLNRLFPQHPRKLLWLYWWSPIALYVTYWNGQTDIIPIALLLASLVLLRDLRPRASGIALGLSLSAKFSMLLAVPFLAIYLWRNKRLRTLQTPFAAGLAIGLIPQALCLFSPGFLRMVLGTQESARIFDFALPLGHTMQLYLTPTLYLLAAYAVWRLRRISFDLLLAVTGLSFFLVVMTTPAPPGWYLWLVPFLVAHQLQGDRSAILLTAALSALVIGMHALISPGATIEPFGWTLAEPLAPLAAAMSPHVASLWMTLVIATGVVLILQMLRERVARNDYFRISQKPLRLGIAGDSGAGKDTLARALTGIFGSHTVVHLSGDDYHVWDRYAPMWKGLTHLNPRANDLQRFNSDALALMDGKPVVCRHYDHKAGRFLAPVVLQRNDVVVVSGLHALRMPRLSKRFDVAVFLDIDEDLRRAWKIHRDVNERGHALDTVLRSLERRAIDSQRYIHPQRAAADLILKLRPVNQRQLESAASPHAIPLKLSAQIRNGTYHERLARILIGICGLHLDIELAEDSDEVGMTIEGDVSAEDIALAAASLAPNLQEMLDIRPQWEDGMTGIMQLMVLLQIEESLKNRIR
ncbi:MAG: phosphoribulokinase/uridine kinase [Lysobacter sp.]|nr:MAG: phosphoribulokinase/uridine kinase [Lysobacter sp.]